MRPAVNANSDHPAVLDKLKQLALYTDCYGNAHWSQPYEIIDEKLCGSILAAARVLVPRKETTAREIELWIEHVGDRDDWPTFEGPADFFRAMKEEGLSDHDDAHLTHFLGVSPSERRLS